MSGSPKLTSVGLGMVEAQQIAHSISMVNSERERNEARSELKSVFTHAVRLSELITSSNSQPPIHKIVSKQNATIKVFVNTCKRWHLDERQQMILLGYSESSIIDGELLAGRTTELSRDVEDRAGFVIGIGLGLSAIFGNQREAEMSWLNLRRNSLGCKTAIEYMLEGSMLNLIVVSQMIRRERGI